MGKLDGKSWKGERSADLRVVTDRIELSHVAADAFCTCANSAIAERGRFRVTLAGGATPLGLYSDLAEARTDRIRALPWDRIDVFFSDERCLPPDNPETNFYSANHALLSRVHIPRHNVHRIEGELDPQLAPSRYESVIRSVFNLQDTEWPRFDLVLLGLGMDGHIASLMPGTAALTESRRLVVANWVPSLGVYRVTFTLGLINHAGQIILLVSGSNKAEIMRNVFGGVEQRYPCQHINPADGRLLWIADLAAAALLENEHTML